MIAMLSQVLDAGFAQLIMRIVQIVMAILVIIIFIWALSLIFQAYAIS